MKPTKSEQAFRVALSDTIRERRQARGWTQAVLSRRASITQASVSNYEATRRDVPLLTLGRLAAAFEVLPETLIEEARTRAAGERAA